MLCRGFSKIDNSRERSQRTQKKSHGKDGLFKQKPQLRCWSSTREPHRAEHSADLFRAFSAGLFFAPIPRPRGLSPAAAGVAAGSFPKPIAYPDQGRKIYHLASRTLLRRAGTRALPVLRFAPLLFRTSLLKRFLQGLSQFGDADLGEGDTIFVIGQQLATSEP
jgi:hypothetical protein